MPKQKYEAPKVVKKVKSKPKIEEFSAIVDDFNSFGGADPSSTGDLQLFDVKKVQDTTNDSKISK